MSSESIRLDLIYAAIHAVWETGSPVAKADVLAAVAMRRWGSSESRGVDRYDRDARLRDLASGLVEVLERGPRRVGSLRRDYEWLAGQIADAIWSLDS